MHAIDVVPTILEFAGVPFPTVVDGVEQKPLAGRERSPYTFDGADEPERHTVQYSEMFGCRALYHGRVEGGRRITTSSSTSRVSTSALGAVRPALPIRRNATTSPSSPSRSVRRDGRSLVGRGRGQRCAAARQPPVLRVRARASLLRRAAVAIRLLARSSTGARERRRQHPQPPAHGRRPRAHERPARRRRARPRDRCSAVVVPRRRRTSLPASSTTFAGWRVYRVDAPMPRRCPPGVHTLAVQFDPPDVVLSVDGTWIAEGQIKRALWSRPSLTNGDSPSGFRPPTSRPPTPTTAAESRPPASSTASRSTSRRTVRRPRSRSAGRRSTRNHPRWMRVALRAPDVRRSHGANENSIEAVDRGRERDRVRSPARAVEGVAARSPRRSGRTCRRRRTIVERCRRRSHRPSAPRARIELASYLDDDDIAAAEKIDAQRLRHGRGVRPPAAIRSVGCRSVCDSWVVQTNAASLEDAVGVAAASLINPPRRLLAEDEERRPQHRDQSRFGRKSDDQLSSDTSSFGNDVQLGSEFEHPPAVRPVARNSVRCRRIPLSAWRDAGSDRRRCRRGTRHRRVASSSGRSGRHNLVLALLNGAPAP